MIWRKDRGSLPAPQGGHSAVRRCNARGQCRSSPGRLLRVLPDCSHESGRPQHAGGTRVPGSARSAAGRSSFLFVTNVIFLDPPTSNGETAIVENLSCETVNALEELVNILRLAVAVKESTPAPGDQSHSRRLDESGSSGSHRFDRPSQFRSGPSSRTAGGSPGEPLPGTRSAIP